MVKNQTKNMRMKKFFGLGSVLAALMCAGVAHAAHLDDTLLLTQTSSTDLTGLWDGSVPVTIENIGPNAWWVFTPEGLTGGGQWADPGEPGDVNTLGTLGGVGLSFAEAPYIGGPEAANDTPGGLFGDKNGTVIVTFDDVVGDGNGNNGNLGNAPDSTTTMPLLGMAFAGLCGFAKRFRK